MPLLIKPPRSAQLGPTRIDAPVSLMDVAPSVCELAGFPPGGTPFLGRSLTPLVKQPELRGECSIVSELSRQGINQYAIRRGASKYIATFSPRKREEFFDLEQDPGERHNLLDSLPAETLDSFREELRAHWEATAGSGLFLSLSNDGEPRPVALEIHAGQPLSNFRLLHCEWKEDEFELRPEEPVPGLLLSFRVGGADPRDGLNLRTDQALVTVRIEVQGELLPVEDLWLGTSDEHPRSNPFDLRLDDPRLAWEAREAPADPPGLSCRFWVRSRTDVELDEEELSLLQKLGY